MVKSIPNSQKRVKKKNISYKKRVISNIVDDNKMIQGVTIILMIGVISKPEAREIVEGHVNYSSQFRGHHKPLQFAA